MAVFFFYILIKGKDNLVLLKLTKRHRLLFTSPEQVEMVEMRVVEVERQYFEAGGGGRLNCGGVVEEKDDRKIMVL